MTDGAADSLTQTLARTRSPHPSRSPSPSPPSRGFSRARALALLLLLLFQLRVEVTAKDESSGEAQWIETVVMNDAKLNSRKGFNLPATIVPGEALTPKDKEDLEFVMSDEFGAIGVDWLALS